MPTQVNAASFNAAFKDALTKHTAEFQAKAKAAGVDDAREAVSVTDFCALWPKVKRFLGLAITALGWFKPSMAAAAQAFITAFESTVLPVICPVTPPAP